MAVCMVFSPPKDLYSKETYNNVLEHLGDGFPPAAMDMHVMGTNEDGEIRIVDIFESAEAFQQFAETHLPVYEALGISLDDVLKYAQVFNIEKTIK